MKQTYHEYLAWKFYITSKFQSKHLPQVCIGHKAWPKSCIYSINYIVRWIKNNNLSEMLFYDD